MIYLRVPINTTGYGYAGAGYAAGFSRLGIDISLSVISILDQNIYTDYGLQGIPIVETPPPGSDVFVFWGLNWEDPVKNSGAYRKVLVSTFETTPKSLPPGMAAYGTASKYWCKRIENLTRTAFSAPHAYFIDEGLPPGNPVRPYPLRQEYAPVIDEDSMILFSIGKHEYRKGTYFLLDAVERIGQYRPITLFLAAYNPFSSEKQPVSYLIGMGARNLGSFKGSLVFQKNLATILLLPRFPSSARTDLLSMALGADRFISLSLSEGWNLPLFEAMSLGQTSIATSLTAHTDYCNSDNCGLLLSGGYRQPRYRTFDDIEKFPPPPEEGAIIEKILEKKIPAPKGLSGFTWKSAAKKISEVFTKM